MAAGQWGHRLGRIESEHVGGAPGLQRSKQHLQLRRAGPPLIERILHAAGDRGRGDRAREIAAHDHEPAVARAVAQRGELHPVELPGDAAGFQLLT